MEPVPLDLNLVKARYQANPGIWRDLDRLGVHAWPGVLGYFMLGEEDTRRFSEPATLNIDDRLTLEFTAPRALYLDTAPQNWQLMRRFKVAEFPHVTPDSRGELEQADVRYWIGMGYLSRQLFEDALAHFQRALQLDPGHTPSLLAASEAHLGAGRPDVALDLARRALAREPGNAEAFFLAGLAAERLKLPAQALTLFQGAVGLRPQNRDYQAALTRVSGGAIGR